MARKDFDNLMKIIEGAVVLSGTTIVSVEIDLELPRGFIAKIFRVEIRLSEFPSEDFQAISVDKIARITAALLRDPDDITTITLGSNRVQHDVIFDAEWSILIVAGTAGDPGIIVFPTGNFVLDIPEHIDMITARNLRFNVQGADANAADLTETVAICLVYYTLEKISDDDILQLLDIL